MGIRISYNCLKRGINLHPKEPGLRNNLGNCYLDKEIPLLAISSYRRALTIDPGFADARISLASNLRELGYKNLSYGILKNTYFENATTDEERNKIQFKLLEAALSLHTQDSEKFQANNFEKLASIMEETVKNNIGATDPCRAWILMTQLWCNLDQLEKARRSLDQLIRDTNRFLAENSQLSLKKTFISDWHSLNWNLGILNLKKVALKRVGNFLSMACK